MNVAEMREFLKDLPDEMKVVLEAEDDVFITVCSVNSSVIDLQLIEDDDDIEEDSDEVVEQVLLLAKCTCGDEELYDGSINSRPELN